MGIGPFVLIQDKSASQKNKISYNFELDGLYIRGP